MANIKVIDKIWARGHSCSLLAGVKSGTTFLDDSMYQIWQCISKILMIHFYPAFGLEFVLKNTQVCKHEGKDVLYDVHYIKTLEMA